MNRNRILTLSVLFLALTGVVLTSGCKAMKRRRIAKEQAEAASPVQGSWKVLGYVNPGESKLRPLPEDQERGIVIHCKDDGTNGRFVGHTKVNQITGQYTLSPKKGIIVSNFGGTKMGEPKWGNRFWLAMKSIHHWDIIEPKKGEFRKLYLKYDEMNAKIVFEELPPEKKKKKADQ